MEKKEFDKLPIGTKIHARVENWYRRCRYELDFIIFKNFQGKVCAISNQEPNSDCSTLVWKEYEWKELENIKVIGKE
jgi:hypothetical protein